MKYINVYITEKEKYYNIGHNIACEVQDIEYCLRNSFSDAKPEEIDFIVTSINNCIEPENLNLYTTLGKCKVHVFFSNELPYVWTLSTEILKYQSNKYKNILNKLKAVLSVSEIINSSMGYNNAPKCHTKDKAKDILISLEAHGGNTILTLSNQITGSVTSVNIIHFLHLTHEDVIDIKNANMEI